MASYIDTLKQEDGNLWDPVNYIGYTLGDNDIYLDGNFTAAQLRALAEYMESHGRA